MASNAWPSQPVRSELAADRAGMEKRTLGLRQMLLSLCEAPVKLTAAVANITSGSWTLAHTYQIRAPEYAGRLKLALNLQAVITTGQGEWRTLCGSTYGNTITVANTTAARSGPSKILLGEPGNEIPVGFYTIYVQGRITSGAGTMSLDNAGECVWSWFEEA